MIKAVIFDFGGVLTVEHDVEFFKEFSNKLKISYDIFMEAFRKFSRDYFKNRLTKEQFWENIQKELGIEYPENPMDLLQEKYRKEIPKPGMVDLIKKLKQRYVVALLSNVDPDMLNFNKENKVYDIFSTVVLSSEVGHVKPEKEIYEILLEKIKIPANQCVFVDDRERNLSPAKELEMHTILFKNIDQLKNDLKTLDLSF